jgi:hypothetical protein
MYDAALLGRILGSRQGDTGWDVETIGLYEKAVRYNIGDVWGWLALVRITLWEQDRLWKPLAVRRQGDVFIVKLFQILQQTMNAEEVASPVTPLVKHQLRSIFTM